MKKTCKLQCFYVFVIQIIYQWKTQCICKNFRRLLACRVSLLAYLPKVKTFSTNRQLLFGKQPAQHLEIAVLQKEKGFSAAVVGHQSNLLRCQFFKAFENQATLLPDVILCLSLSSILILSTHVCFWCLCVLRVVPLGVFCSIVQCIIVLLEGADSVYISAQ